MQHNFLWRTADCMRNSINSLARVYYTARELAEKSSTTVLQQLQEVQNVDWHSYPGHFKYGTLFKKLRSEKTVHNPFLRCA